MESDPIGLLGGINTYSYARNLPSQYADLTGLDVTINVERSGVSRTGRSVYGVVEAKSTFSPLLPVNGVTLESTAAGDCGCKDPIPAGSYQAFVRRDHQPNRVELSGVPGYTNIQIHNGSYPRDFKGCIGVGNHSALDFINGSKVTLEAIIRLIDADGTGRIVVNVSPVPLGPVPPSPPDFLSRLPP